MLDTLRWEFNQTSECNDFHKMVVTVINQDPDFTIFKGQHYVVVSGDKEKLQELYSRLPV